MTIIDFNKECTSIDAPIGDLVNDILEDRDIPSEKTEQEIIEYLDSKTNIRGTNDVFQEFIAEYKNKK